MPGPHLALVDTTEAIINVERQESIMQLRTVSLFALPALALALAGCEVQQEEPARAPEVDVQEGQLPEYEVEPGTLTVEEDTAQIEVPDVDVQSSTGGGSS